MAELSVARYQQDLKRFIPGLALTAVIAFTTAWLGNQPVMSGLGLGALTLAIIAGIVVGNTFYPALHPQCDEGVQFAKQKLLRLGIILYGFRLTFQQVMDVGLSGVIIDVLMLGSTFILASVIGSRLLGIDRKTAWLIGAGSSICGAAAVLAAAPVVKAEPAKVAVAVATVVIFGTLGIFLYPLIWHEFAQYLPGISLTQFGVYTGSTMHEVAQVVAAGHAVSPETENAAVIAKMLRVMMLAPFLLLLSVFISRDSGESRAAKQPIIFPWFALIFILVALFNSFHFLPAPMVAGINTLDNVLLAMAMAALGLSTSARQLVNAGARPFMLGLILFVWLVLGGGAINLLIHHFMS
ncbi:YeiH family putative sulfate export transporter [Pantoea sp.]|uniref:YeiH family putative sulfate export transporter n=1 Tax=Pantoea sp. TaxID=69393 RepID=UPI0028A581C4|nr:YeiH family putative sulfate export transporter [Pantoea sp.]